MADDLSGAVGVPTGVPASLAGGASGELSGRELGGFALKELIGAGGYGDVYLAEQLGLKREAIVKVLRPDGINEDRIQRFLREAQLASRLDHPFAAHIYAFGTEPDGVFWIAMEHVRGASLRAVLEAQGPMSLERFVPLLERVCDVVHTAHEQGIVHRDLKPDNIMVISRAGKLMPKLLDFGIARAIESDTPAEQTAASAEAMSAPVTTTTQRGGVLGSPSYMAPEVWVDPHSAGPPADQYALGALAYEALSGRIAFTGKTVMEVARAHSRGTIEPLGNGFTPELEAAIRRSLSRKAADRFGNVLELAQAIRAASGIGEVATDLPQLDEDLRVTYLSTAPQPLADAVAAYDAAKNAHQARAALWGIARAAATYVGIVALACRTRVGSGGAGDSDHAQKLLRDLRRHGLAPGDWIELARQLTQPFARLPDTYPVPELALLLHRTTGGVDPFASVLAGSLVESVAESSLDAVTQSVARELPAVTALLRALRFLVDYQLVVPREGGAEAWMGTRGGAHQTIKLRRDVSLDRPLLADASGGPIVSLWPLVQVHTAVPGHNEELFLLAGPGRAGARLVSSPHGFEHADPTLWDWYREQLFRTDEPPSEAAADAAPYRGLSSYREGDAQWFFGREREAEALGNRLKLEAFVAVVGPSGVGKSSFVHAGLAPSLAGWRVVTARPQRAPFEHLGAALGIADLQAAATTNLAAAADSIRALATASSGLLVVIDQFEETITLASSPAERDLFAKLLLAITRSPDQPVRVVVTLRDDFLIRAEQLPGFDRALASGLQLLGPLGPAALEKILVEPARRAGYEFEDATMPARMIAEVAGTPAAVALISFTATRLWELRDRHFHQLPKKAYDAIGGVGGALAQHADDTVEAMPAAERSLVRKAFRHLVTFEGTRAVLGRDELVQLLGGGNDAERAIERLIEARLVTASEGEDGQAVVEIVHEALLAAWPRLAEWRREDVEGSRFHEQLRAAAKQWHDRGRPRGALWRGDALAEYQLWRRRNPADLAPIEAAFGNASVASETRGRRIRRTVVGVIVALAATFVAFLWHTNTVEKRRLREATFDQGRLLMLAGDKLGALKFLAEAYDRGETGAANRVLIEEAMRATRARRLTLEGHAGLLTDVAASRDGKLYATASVDHTARLWDASTGKLLETLTASDDVFAVVFSLDSTLLLYGGNGKATHVWSTQQHRELASVPTGPVLGLELSEDGQLVLASGVGMLRVFKVTGEEVATMKAPSGAVGAAFCDHGAKVASWDSDGHVGLWQARDATSLASYDHANGAIAGAVAADCSFVAVGTQNGELDILRADGTVIAKPGASDQVIRSVAISHDSTMIATAGSDGTTRVWDQTGRAIHALPGATASAAGVTRFSADDKLLLAANADGTIRLWRTDSWLEFANLSGHTNSVIAAAFGARGQLITGSWDHRAIVWDVAASSDIVPLATKGIALRIAASHMTYSPDGRRIAIATGDGALDVLDADDGHLLCRAQTNTPIDQVVWSPDSRRLASMNDSDHTVPVWDAGTCTATHRLVQPAGATCVTFTPDGSLVTGGDDGRVRRWSIDDERLVTTYAPMPVRIDLVGVVPNGTEVWATAAGSTAQVLIQNLDHPTTRTVLDAGGTALSSVLFDRDRVIAPSFDQLVWVWDRASTKVIAKLEGTGAMISVDVSPDGRYLAGIGGTSPTIWDRATLEPIGILVGHGDLVTQGSFIGNDLLETVANDGTVRMWDVSHLRQLQVIRDASELAISPDRTRVAIANGHGAGEPKLSAPTPELPKELDALK